MGAGRHWHQADKKEGKGCKWAGAKEVDNERPPVWIVKWAKKKKRWRDGWEWSRIWGEEYLGTGLMVKWCDSNDAVGSGGMIGSAGHLHLLATSNRTSRPTPTTSIFYHKPAQPPRSGTLELPHDQNATRSNDRWPLGAVAATARSLTWTVAPPPPGLYLGLQPRSG